MVHSAQPHTVLYFFRNGDDHDHPKHATTMSGTSTRTMSPRPARRSSSRSSRSATSQPHSPSGELPTQEFRKSWLVHLDPSVVGGHYSAAKIGHRRSDRQRASFGTHGAQVELNEQRAQIVHDLKEVRIIQSRFTRAPQPLFSPPF